MTKILTQKYRMIVDEPEECRIGQMIIEGDDVIGFISHTNGLTGICEVILFEPTELEMVDGMEKLEDFISSDEPIKIFESVLYKATPEVQTMWKEAVIQQNRDQDTPDS